LPPFPVIATTICSDEKKGNTINKKTVKWPLQLPFDGIAIFLIWQPVLSKKYTVSKNELIITISVKLPQTNYGEFYTKRVK